MLRKNFHEKLEHLNNSILTMGSLVEEVIQLSIEGLYTKNLKKSEQAIKLDDKIDKLELDIEKQCIELLSLQAPIAIDLRKISAILKMITDLERIADYGVNIAYDTKGLSDLETKDYIEDIMKMSEIVKTMIRKSLESFEKEDMEIAKEVGEMDDLVDDLYDKTYMELVLGMKSNIEKSEQIVKLLFIARHLERMADHVTNLCERIIYMTTSKRMLF